jgi:hypothetical protein
MLNTGVLVTIGIIILVVILIVFGWLWWSSRRVNLTRASGDQKPVWMRTDPHPETLAATQADGEGLALYDHDKGEKIAAPFAEQIEDILRHQMSADAYLSSLDVDFGTSPDGGLEIRVGDDRYTSIEQVPDLRLREAITRAVATYNQRGK